MKKIKYLFSSLLLVVLLTKCSTGESLDTEKSVVSIDDNQNKTKFDKFLDREYRQAYNIEFNYKMKDRDADMNYTLSPASYVNSVKMANLFKYLCLDSYKKVAPKNFLKKYFPKKISLIGSPAYNNNGTEVLGTAEGGLAITLYKVNSLRIYDMNYMFRYYFRTIFHEFSHIMHQNVDYTRDFKAVTPTDYVAGSWNVIEPEKALSLGFVSPYSMKEYNEDFVETIAHYVTKTDDQWNDMLKKAGDEGARKIDLKLGYVKDYMLSTWNVDLEKLKEEVLKRAENVPNIDLTNID